MERLDRILKILHEIIEKNKDGEYPLIKELAFQFKVSRRTIERDLSMLERNGFHFSRGKKGLIFRRLSVDEFFSDLTSNDYYSMSLALKLFASYSSESFGRRSQYILRVLLNKLGTNEKNDLKKALENVDLTYQRREFIDDSILKIILASCRERKTLNVEYAHPIHGTQSLLLSPQKVIFKKGHWYILTYSHTHKAALLFRISRIKKIEEKEEKYVQIPPEKVEKLIKSCWETHISERTYKIKIWFDDKAAPYVKDTIRHPSGKITSYSDGSIDYEIEVSGWKEIMWWTLSWGSHARLLEPEWMVEKTREELKKTLDKY